MRYAADELTEFATSLTARVGLPEACALDVAEVLVEGDLLGHSTHGLALLGYYLEEISTGSMTREGVPEVLADHGGIVLWDGRRLPGPWLVRRATGLAIDRVAAHGVVTVSIRRSHHTACLGAFLERATREGLVMLLMVSDPGNAAVAPFGGIERRLTANPIACGIPTGGDPILIDVSTSTVAQGRVWRAVADGERLGGDWVIDARGQATDDPRVVDAEPLGAILPLGGTELGYKGFALALMVEALTAALAGYGRARAPAVEDCAVFLQVIDPAAFGGRECFLSETSFLSHVCRRTAVAERASPVRLPGERALALRHEQLVEGVALHPSIMPSLDPWAQRLGVPLPIPL